MKKYLLFLLSALLLASCQSRQGIQSSESKNVCQTNKVSKEHLTDLLYSGALKDVQFIDVRTPHKFAMGHLPGAINLPAKHFYEPKYLGQIPADKVLMIYGDSDQNPEIVAMMLKHFDRVTTYVIPGSYDYIRKHIMDHYGIHGAMYDDEVPLVDYFKAVNEIRQREGGGGAAPAAAKPAAAPKPVVKRKKKEVTGGCG